MNVTVSLYIYVLYNTSNQIVAPKYQFKCIMFFLWPPFAFALVYHTMTLKLILWSHILVASVSDPRHEKTDLMVFVVVIPKEGWTYVAVPILLLV